MPETFRMTVLDVESLAGGTVRVEMRRYDDGSVMLIGALTPGIRLTAAQWWKIRLAQPMNSTSDGGECAARGGERYAR